VLLEEEKAMTTRFRIDAGVDETAMWEALRRDGSIDVVYGNGVEETLTGPVYWMSPVNFQDDGDVNDSEFNFMAGYASNGNRNISDTVGIPSEVMASMFAGHLPAGMSIDWNGCESTHFVETRKAMTVREAKAIIVPVLESNGFQLQS
jgi:hypothetical protein